VRKNLDLVLIVALALGFAFSLYGIGWGGLEGGWNSDQMAFKNLFRQGRLPFEPLGFQKPPFHTYFNFFLSVLPTYIIGKIFHLPIEVTTSIKVLWSRTLTILLFLGAVYLVFIITKRFFGLFAARIITIIFATSAGLISESHFLTADVPVLFWMLLSFYFAQSISFNGRLLDYAGAGFFAGIATATKYNGLAIGIAIVVAHVLSLNSISWKVIINRKIILGLFMIPVGFLAGNPFAVISHRTFISDFMYNYILTPIYDGNSEAERSYWRFFLCFIEIIGLPSFLVFAGAIIISIYLCLRFGSSQEKKGMLLIFSILLLYYYKFGAFPRLETRFVMPVVPFWLIASGPFWNKMKASKRVLAGLFTILIGYNLVSSFYVGKRFVEDPRMHAIEWVKKNVATGSSIEASQYSPEWNLLPLKLTNTKMPIISGRRKFFEELLPANSWILKQLRIREKEEASSIQWYSLKELLKRNPDYIAVDSLYYLRFFRGRRAELYSSIRNFYSELLNEKFPYRIVFNRITPSTHKWLYPYKIMFVDDNRLTLLKKVNLR